MREKRIRTKLFQVWLHTKELHFLNDYAEQNLSTSSEIIRGWIHEVMKREGYEIKEPSLPEGKIKRGRK
jgi:hypothetical protein